MNRNLICLAILAGASLLRPSAAHAAESYDNCTGFITSLPATIATQGTWCLDRDLATAIASGSAITVATNNVTIDCNHFKIGGLQAGTGTLATGVVSNERLNTTVRNCNIRGFYQGVVFGGGGHLVEGSRFDGNTGTGIALSSSGSMIRNNQVIDSGGSSLFTSVAYAMIVVNGVDVIDNTVNGVEASGENSSSYGIYASGNGDGSVVGNRVRGLALKGGGLVRAIFVDSLSAGMTVRDNTVKGPGVDVGIGVSVGIRCLNNQVTARGNLVSKFPVGIENCLSDANSVNMN